MKKWNLVLKRQKTMGQALAILVTAGLALTGCGSSKSYSYEATNTAAEAPAAAGQGYDSGGYLGDGGYMDEAAAVTEEAVAEEGKGELSEFDDYAREDAGAETPKAQDSARKLIRNVNLEAETENFDELLKDVRRRTEQLGGYIEESYTYNGSSYSGNRLRNANLTIRVPAEHLDEFLENVAQVSNVISRNESVPDVTLQFVDLERLSQVRYQLESMESQLRVLENQVSYSTVYLYINEVVKLTPVKEQSVWEKISTGFVNSLYDVGNTAADFGIGFLIDLPYLLVWVLIIAVAAVIVRLILRQVRRKHPEKKESISLKQRWKERRSKKENE